jgi:D-glycerate 3-kinase
MIVVRVEQRLCAADGRPLVVGLCGAQGSGKSTIAAVLERYFSDRDVPTAIVSLDDLYRTRREREALARDVHPLLRTRGVPGTHDVALGLALFADIDAGMATPLPRFDKAIDDRAPPADWDVAPADTRLVIFEGWCVGARPQPPSALVTPINELERIEDAGGGWRRYIDAALAGDYQQLFARIDLLVLLAAPTFETVFGWRIQQERAQHARTGRGMTDDEVVRFVQHYERLTRHILAEMPDRADLVLRLDETRALVSSSR